MAVTPNYSWPVPVDTDYVKDGAEAIKDLGDAIDSTVFGLPSGALTLVSATTITTSNTVTVDNVFTSTYRNYKIILTSTGQVGTGEPQFQLRAGGVTTAGSGYNYSTTGSASNGAGTAGAVPSASNWGLGYTITPLGIFASEMTLYNPQIATETMFSSRSTSSVTATNSYNYAIGGMHTATTAHDGLIITNSGGNFSGVLRVYGLQD